MTTKTWQNRTGGDFNTSANWTDGVPGPDDTALITASGTYTVTSSQSNSVDSLEMAKGATLAINHLNFSVASSVGALAGTITVADDAILQLGAQPIDTTFDNTGTITVLGEADPTDILIAGAVTLTGKGKINLAGEPNARLTSETANSMLTNESTISGTGILGDDVFSGL